MFNFNGIVKNNRINTLRKNALLNSPKTGELWEIGFNTELLWDGSRIKFIVISDSSNRHIISLEETKAGISVHEQLVTMLERLQKDRQLPLTLVYDHSAFISIDLDKWCSKNAVRQVYLFLGQSSPGTYFRSLMRRKNVKLLKPFRNNGLCF